MGHGVNLPITNDFSNPQLLSKLGQEPETAGWDGVFVWDMLLSDPEPMPHITDP